MSERTATAVDSVVSATASGNAPAINIVLGSEAVRPIAWFLAVILALVVMLGIGLAYAIALTSQYRDYSITQTQEDRITQSKIEALRNEVAELKGKRP